MATSSIFTGKINDVLSEKNDSSLVFFWGEKQRIFIFHKPFLLQNSWGKMDVHFFIPDRHHVSFGDDEKMFHTTGGFPHPHSDGFIECGASK